MNNQEIIRQIDVISSLEINYFGQEMAKDLQKNLSLFQKKND